MRVCIVGPMRGLPGSNFAAFDEATTRWLEAGHVVYNPAQADRAAGFDGTAEPPHGFLEIAMSRDIQEYVRADALAVLPGWEQSRMAPVEIAFVRALDPPRLIFDAITMQPLAMDGSTMTSTGAVRGGTDQRCSILAEADALVDGARRRSYGHPREDYGRVAQMFSAILGMDVSPSQAILCMIAVKISRECHRPARDTRVDIAGYAKCLDLVSEDNG